MSEARNVKTVMLFGAGQAGTMALRLLGPDYRALCFADNDANKQGGRVAGVPVLSPEDGVAKGPDTVCICALGAERNDEMRVQLDSLGYTGKVFSVQALKLFDARSATMRLLAEQIEALHVPGDVAELGVYRGDFAALISAAFPQRRIHLFDTFEGFAARDVEVERRCSFSSAETGDFADTGVELVRGRLSDPELAVFHCGRFPDTFAPCESVSFAFVSVDADLYAPTSVALPLFWERLSPGGAIMVHDANSTQFTGVGKAVDEFCTPRRILPMPVCDMHGSVVLRK